MVVTRAAAKRIVGPQGKRKLAPPPPILQIMILKLSPPRCVISKESVQQKWIDELWFRKQLSTCLFLWTFNYNSCAPGHHSVRTPSQWAWSPTWLGLPLPILEYLYYKWPRICSVCRIHTVLPSFVTSHPVYNKSSPPFICPIFSLLCSLCPFSLAMHCLTFGLRLLITTLVSSNFSYRGVASTLLLVRREFMRNVDAPLLVYLEHIFNNELDHPLTYISCLI
jgi:hypothetical protein